MHLNLKGKNTDEHKRTNLKKITYLFTKVVKIEKSGTSFNLCLDHCGWGHLQKEWYSVVPTRSLFKMTRWLRQSFKLHVIRLINESYSLGIGQHFLKGVTVRHLLHIHLIRKFFMQHLTWFCCDISCTRNKHTLKCLITLNFHVSKCCTKAEPQFSLLWSVCICGTRAKLKQKSVLYL